MLGDLRLADQKLEAIGLAVKLPFATPEEFLAKYGTNLTRGGIFLRAKSVKPPGTAVTLDLKLSSGERVIYASAVVHFVTGQQGQGLSGMGLKFLTLDPGSQRFLDTQVAALPHAQSTQPPVPPGVGSPDYAIPAAPSPARPPSPPVPVGIAAATGKPSAPTLAAAPPVSAVSTLAAVPPAAAAFPAAARAPESAPTLADGPVTPTAPAFEEPKQPPLRTGPIIGIDLGTTNSCAAFVRNGRPAVLPSREGYNTVPSIIALNTRGKLVVGHPAKGQMLTNPQQTVSGAKRLVGRAYDSPQVQLFKHRFHYEIAEGANGEAAVKLGDRIYSLQQIAALVLREVRELAQNQLGTPVSRAVITVPANYNDNQRQAVREAGRLAGLYVERILNEPTAAALAYGSGRSLKQRVLVYDLGGGTFDASVLELSDNVYEVISTGGDTFLGGIDFDNAIVEHLLTEFKVKTGQTFQGDRVAMQRITDAAERAKCILSERTDSRIHVPFVTLIDNQPYDLDVTLTREKLIELTRQLVERTITVCDEVLKAKNLTPAMIDEVILVGGQSRFPLVHERTSAFFNKIPSKNVHPDEAVALGAALLAHSLGQLEGVVLIDVLPMAIGVGLPGGRFKPIMDRNTPLPSSKQYTLTTSRDGQTELEVSIFQGSNERAQENEYLGTLKLTGLPRGPKGTLSVGVTFEVSNECLLQVTAKEVSSGKEVRTTFSTRDTPAAVKARIAKQDAGKTSAPNEPSEPSPSGIARPEGSAASAQPAAGTGTLPGKVGLVGWLKRLLRAG